MAAKDVLGRWGEGYAAAYLERAGYRIIERNWRCRSGEIDLVAFDLSREELAFVEVKTRSSVLFGHPLEAITEAKLARLRRLASSWCQAHEDEPDSVLQRVRRIRIDAIGIVAASGQEPALEHLRRVF